MRPCNILYFLRETTHICKYLKIHRLSWAIYILPLSIGLRQIDSFIDSIQWLFSAVCLALNAGEETATSNRCYLLYCFKLCLSNHAFIKQHILPGGLTGLKFIMKVWRAGGQVIILSKRSSLQLRSCLLLMNASLFNQPSSSKNLPFLIDTYKGAIVFLSSLPFRDPCSLKLY